MENMIAFLIPSAGFTLEDLHKPGFLLPVETLFCFFKSETISLPHNFYIFVRLSTCERSMNPV
jgi:hypothetical protein